VPKLLAGYRIIESSMLLNGSATGMLLADLGADVIKVESPALGDYLRLPETRHLHLQANKGKRSLSLDLKQDKGREVFLRLLLSSDALVTNAVADRNDRLGIGYAQLRTLKPDIVYCQNTGFGATGPYRDIPVHGHMMDSLAGAMPVHMAEDGLVEPSTTHPRRSGSLISSGDAVSMGALYAALHVAAALAHREKNRQGCYIDVSSAHAALASAWIAASTLINRPQRGGWWQNPENTRPVARYQAYAARDGKFLLFCPEEHRFWHAFCDLVGRQDLKSQERGETLRREVQSIFAGRDRDEWMQLALEHRLPMSPINDGIDEVRADPQINSRAFFLSGEADGEPFTYLGEPAIVDGENPEAPRPAPELGQDNAQLLTELGYGPADIEQLAATRVIGAYSGSNHISSAIYGAG
jgi:formyl-CoA transferase